MPPKGVSLVRFYQCWYQSYHIPTLPPRSTPYWYRDWTNIQRGQIRFHLPAHYRVLFGVESENRRKWSEPFILNNNHSSRNSGKYGWLIEEAGLIKSLTTSLNLCIFGNGIAELLFDLCDRRLVDQWTLGDLFVEARADFQRLDSEDECCCEIGKNTLLRKSIRTSISSTMIGIANTVQYLPNAGLTSASDFAKRVRYQVTLSNGDIRSCGNHWGERGGGRSPYKCDITRTKRFCIFSWMLQLVILHQLRRT